MLIQTPNRGNTENKTNCIVEIPQNIKVTLINDVFTLKAGSKVWVPDGYEEDGETKKFKEVDILADLVLDFGSSLSLAAVAYYSPSNDAVSFINIADVSSGTTDPGNNTFWYDTVNNSIRRKSSTGVVDDGCSFPICIIRLENGTPTKILQIFNGFGYIGSVIFALPKTKVLVPYGRETDGSFIDKLVTVSPLKPLLSDVNVVINNCWITVNAGVIALLAADRAEYRKEDNFNYFEKNRTNVCHIGYVSKTTNGVITAFTCKDIYRAKDCNDEGYYSQHETFTGKYWIDGKPIYRKVINDTIATYTDSSVRRRFTGITTIPNIATFITINGGYTMHGGSSDSYTYTIVSTDYDANRNVMRGFTAILRAGSLTYYIDMITNFGATSVTAQLVVEYTKTTD